MTDREFWEKCGFRYDDSNPVRPPWIYPDGTRHQWPPPGGITLDNLFKYAVPKIIEQGYGVSLHWSEEWRKEDKTWMVCVGNDDYNTQIYEHDKDPAQALKRAIEGVI